VESARPLIESVDHAKTAILLDVDGTLLNIAPTPGEVTVEPALKRALARILLAQQGALALVSGRRIGDLDRLFAPLILPAIGGHGAELRLGAVGGDVQRVSDPIDAKLRARLAGIVALDPGLIGEDKGYSYAIHFRLVPQRAKMVQELVAAVCSDFALSAIEILPGKSVIEVKRPAFDKGSAVRDLMQHAPFLGRQPIFVGDDVTDEFVFAVMPEFKGLGFSVGHMAAGAAGCFETPGEVRRWLYRLSAQHESRPQ
jgi:trehalose 6-phosphate phosphatase